LAEFEVWFHVEMRNKDVYNQFYLTNRQTSPRPSVIITIISYS
jgi:hypothetical protein